MTLTPQLAADFDEYPELRAIANAALRHVAGLMSVHSIAGLRRIHKRGVFDHPYDKDVTTPVDIPGVPETVIAGQHAVGKALLDYLAAIGFDGLQLGITKEDAQAMALLWAPPPGPTAPAPASGGDGLDPQPAEEDGSKQPETAQAGQPGQREQQEQPGAQTGTATKKER